MICNKKSFEIIFLVAILLITSSLIGAETFSLSSPQTITPGGANSFSYLNSQGVNAFNFNQNQCKSGQDFLVQIAPFKDNALIPGCSPAIVRSDLLEDQNVPVFCQLAATKINPLIDVKAVDFISFKGQYPKEVAGVGFHPARAALRTQDKLLGSPLANNVGYAVVILKRTPNESAMPDFVNVTLNAFIRYDSGNALGIGKAEFIFADLTGERPNVYYEIGYAHALGKRPILYRKKETKVHFDLSIHNVPAYDNISELKSLLEKRLEAIAGRSPKSEK